MALKLNGTFTTDQGLEVTDPFGFIHFSFSHTQMAVVQFFASNQALIDGKAALNLSGIPSNFTFDYSSTDFFTTNIVQRIHEDIRTEILTYCSEGTVIDIVNAVNVQN